MEYQNNMKVNELRIGNYLQIDSLTDGSNTIVDIDLFHLNEIGSIKYQYKPIPLTEEWFDLNLKCLDSDWDFEGFGSRIIIVHKIHKGIKLESCANNLVAFYLNGNLINIVDYVHQLQNLYFALTNEELTIKL